MSVKLRILRLEESKKINAGPVSYESSDEDKQLLDDTIKSINEGTPMPPSPPCDMTGYSPQRLAVIASTKVWLEEQISEQKRRSEHEQSKKQIA